MLKIKNAVVVVLIFLKHNGLCGILADSNYFFSTVHKFLCTRNAICMDVLGMVVTVHAISEGLRVEPGELVLCGSPLACKENQCVRVSVNLTTRYEDL